MEGSARRGARARASSTDPDADAALGEALYRAGRIDEAGDALQPSAAADDAPARALAQLGLVRAAQGKNGEAAALMERAIAKAPKDPWVAYRAAGAAAHARARQRAPPSLHRRRRSLRSRSGRRGAQGTIRLNRALGERKVWIPVASPEQTRGAAEADGRNRRRVLHRSDALESKEDPALARHRKHRVVRRGARRQEGRTDRALRRDRIRRRRRGTGELDAGPARRSSPIGGVEFADALVTTTKDEFDPQGRIHGVLGLNVFSGYRVTMDLAKGRLALTRCGGEAGGAPLLGRRRADARSRVGRRRRLRTLSLRHRCDALDVRARVRRSRSRGADRIGRRGPHLRRKRRRGFVRSAA